MSYVLNIKAAVTTRKCSDVCHSLYSISFCNISWPNPSSILKANVLLSAPIDILFFFVFQKKKNHSRGPKCFFFNLSYETGRGFDFLAKCLFVLKIVDVLFFLRSFQV